MVCAQKGWLMMPLVWFWQVFLFVNDPGEILQKQGNQYMSCHATLLWDKRHLPNWIGNKKYTYCKYYGFMRGKTKTQGRYQLKSEWAYKCKSTISLMFQTNNDITFSCFCLVVGTLTHIFLLEPSPLKRSWGPWIDLPIQTFIVLAGSYRYLYSL